jgi:ABC-type microcin C transport system duplicated ATPase subunit YejF
MVAQAAEPVLAIRDLRVSFRTGDGDLEAVKGIDLDIGAHETVAIVGESGSGKSQTMMALMSLLATNGTASGRVSFKDGPFQPLAKEPLKPLRGRKITMIFQEPMTSLDPLYRIGHQIALVIRAHCKTGKAQARARALDLLRLVKIPNAEERINAYPHELSGGQRQRVMIAMALANEPDLLIADEPTTALDVTIQAEILALMAELKQRIGMAIVFITHDLGIVRRFADKVYVMRQGEVVESGAVSTIFTAPSHPYTRMLITAEPEGCKLPPPADAPEIVSARDIHVVFRQPGGVFKPAHVITALDGVSLSLKRGATIGLVGESGSGKSTLGRAILKLLPMQSGLVRFEDRALEPLTREEMRPLRRSLQVVFQDPFGSLSPRLSVGAIITEGLLVHEPALSRAERDKRAAQALADVELDPASRNRYPHEFSGGQRQRIAIARAMILKPHVVVLDEPTSALDRTVQKQIIALLRDLQEKHGLSYLFISHDLAVVRAMADTIMVMKDGKVIEEGPTEEIYTFARSDYTKRLIAAAFLNHA